MGWLNINGNWIGRHSGKSWSSYWLTRTPSNLVALANSETEIILSWIDATEASDGLRIYISTDNVTFTEKGTAAYGAESYSATGLITNTLYYFRLVAYKGTNESDALESNTTTLTAWYLAGGVTPANCIAAYQPILSASLAESKVNVKNPGTYNLSSGVDPDHDTTLGLKFNGSSTYLKTGIVPENDQTWSMIIRWKRGAAGGRIAGLYEDAVKDFGLSSSSTHYGGQNGQSNSVADNSVTEGITCLAGPYIYLMGVLKQTIAAGSGNITYDIWIGATHYTAAANFFDGSEALIAIYDTVLTAPQALSLSYRMLYIKDSYNIDLIKNYVNNQFGALICWNMSTFDGNDMATPDQIATFAPTGFDMDNWLDACVAAGMEYAILTAKHYDGFCLWPTEFAVTGEDPYSIEYTAWYAANGNPDIVKLFVDGCRLRGLKVGIYYNMYDSTWVTRSGETHASANAAYIQMVKDQLTELLTNYGKIDSLWFDGWGWSVGYVNLPYATIYDHVKSLQPYCVIVENSQKHPTRTSMVETYEVPMDSVIPAGNVRYAEEVDTPRTDGAWFAFPLSDQSATAFDTSVTIKAAIAQANARNGTYLLAVTPTTAGVLPAALQTIMEEIGT